MGDNFCSDCQLLLDHTLQECPVCRKFSDNDSTHEKCRQDYYIRTLISCFQYNDVAQKLMESYKFRFNTNLARNIAMLIYDDFRVKNIIKENVVLVPIPLHKSREKWRGFNQSQLIADELAKLSNTESIRVRNLLTRVKNTQQQAKLHRADRLRNLKDAFILNPELNISKNMKIVLIDDITTTTSTLNECAKVLSQAGFRDVNGVVFARGN
jgi:competence protein ComFC